MFCWLSQQHAESSQVDVVAGCTEHRVCLCLSRYDVAWNRCAPEINLNTNQTRPDMYRTAVNLCLYTKADMETDTKLAEVSRKHTVVHTHRTNLYGAEAN